MMAQRDVWAETLVAVAERDDRVVVVDADLANSTKADRFAAAYPDRFIEAGIAEQAMVGVAFGLATAGYRPWLSSFGVFMVNRALDQTRMLISQTKVPVRLAAAYTGLLNGGSGKTHQDLSDLAVMRALPDMVVLAPSDEAETRAMVVWAADHDGPVYLRLAREGVPDVLPPGAEFRIGQPVVLREGAGGVVLSTGVQTARVAEALDAGGFEVSHVHLPTIKPLDDDALLSTLAGHSRILTVEEHSIHGGLGSLVAELVAERRPGIQVTRHGLADCWSESGPNDFLLDRYGLSAERIAERFERWLNERDEWQDSILNH